jgi:Na+/phosphate symporter
MLPDPDFLALQELQGRVLARFNIAQSLLANRGGSQAKAFLAGKETLNEWCRQTQHAHYERLRRGGVTLAASAYFLDLFEGMRRVNSHISSIGYAFASPAPRRRVRARAEAVQAVLEPQ